MRFGEVILLNSLKKLINKIKHSVSKFLLYIKKRKLSKEKKVRFGPNTRFSRDTIFEGNNFISTKANLLNCKVGFASYLGIESTLCNAHIGNYTSIGPYVKCIIGNHPTNTFVSTHPAFFSTRKQSGFSFVEKDIFNEFANPIEKGSPYTIRIGNDVWIGARVTIIDGVNIGDGAIIASGALVNKDVAPFSIVGGVPAKEIKKRFGEEEIAFLNKLKWWDKDFEWVKEHASYFTDIKKLKSLDFDN